MVTRRKYEAVAAALLGGLFGLQPVSAQDAGNVTVDVRDCVELESAAERLACFGAQVDAAIEAHGAAESDDVSAESQGREADRGQPANGETLGTSEIRAAGSAETHVVDESRKSEAAEDEYHGTITALRERVPYAYVITLDSGQIWEQVEPKKYRLRPGLEVRIYSTKWGQSYRLSGEDTGGFILVRRVR